MLGSFFCIKSQYIFRLNTKFPGKTLGYKNTTSRDLFSTPTFRSEAEWKD